MVEAPVLYITFARPEYARQSFDAIKKAQPKTLYFYSNKGREEKPEELEKNNIIRSYINEIDWECNLKTFFRDEYVDIYTSLWGAIDWVFDNEEEAIIIEEDVVGSLAFFDYCDKLLPRYRDNDKVWKISGNNFTPKGNPKNLSYFFSNYSPIYGWAGWADRWKRLDRTISDWPQRKRKMLFTLNPIRFIEKKRLAKYYDTIYYHRNDFYPWDAVFTYNMYTHKALGIVPNENLAASIGVSGVHHTKKQIHNHNLLKVPTKKEFEIINSPNAIELSSYGNYYFRHHVLYPGIKNLLYNWGIKLRNRHKD